MCVAVIVSDVMVAHGFILEYSCIAILPFDVSADIASAILPPYALSALGVHKLLHV